MDYGQACRQTFICRITEGLPVKIRCSGSLSLGLAYRTRPAKA